MPERHLRLSALLFLLFAFLGGAALAAENGIELARTESMNTFPPFIEAIADAVENGP